ncbi:MAG: 2-(5''-triphosphoribosyl)-3'-dephosphocoenzyme-A synthase [Paracidovorax wautersii]|uniref:triphosphoribosyl-dephospho-CoA synthase n=1 Tax=Paracidovorax wautersii TaxID=1177982 RepID=A0A7V8JPY2_9BURK|nr:MAG: 2-(5''-triphosphoribosyl)-3'-dephosphocoenzyme-A synthase [Paracidovorax wautersii]
MTAVFARHALAPAPQPSPAALQGLRAARAQAIGRAATLALHDELALAPKPGLVSFADSGSHDDMDAHTFMRSLFALRRYFPQIAALGMALAPFAALERCGQQAEARMLRATGGINTHRGAIFMLGLLCAAAGAASRHGWPLDAVHLQRALTTHWGDALAARAQRAPTLPGGIAARRLGLDTQHVRLHTLLTIMATLDDSNLAHRGGAEGLAYARGAVQAFMAAGGAAAPGALARAQALHQAFVARRLSPGGSADTLAAACWLHRVQAL